MNIESLLLFQKLIQFSFLSEVKQISQFFRLPLNAIPFLSPNEAKKANEGNKLTFYYISYFILLYYFLLRLFHPNLYRLLP